MKQVKGRALRRESASVMSARVKGEIRHGRPRAFPYLLTLHATMHKGVSYSLSIQKRLHN